MIKGLFWSRSFKSFSLFSASSNKARCLFAISSAIFKQGSPPFHSNTRLSLSSHSLPKNPNGATFKNQPPPPKIDAADEGERRGKPSASLLRLSQAQTEPPSGGGRKTSPCPPSTTSQTPSPPLPSENSPSPCPPSTPSQQPSPPPCNWSCHRCRRRRETSPEASTGSAASHIGETSYGGLVAPSRKPLFAGKLRSNKGLRTRMVREYMFGRGSRGSSQSSRGRGRGRGRAAPSSKHTPSPSPTTSTLGTSHVSPTIHPAPPASLPQPAATDPQQLAPSSQANTDSSHASQPDPPSQQVVRVPITWDGQKGYVYAYLISKFEPDNNECTQAISDVIELMLNEPWINYSEIPADVQK
ncbi:hypothetical protein PIB30_041147 [Stylosanthes scabra]|uniref:Uncharacterized protein n=1 Tax=Stylosanthes scabra TaxID=79078 RepID=A0ABU6SF18_9FABA|nr:hypothetical protein [Stylosanthes scabra]